MLYHRLTLCFPLLLSHILRIAQAGEHLHPIERDLPENTRELRVDKVLIEFSHAPNADNMYEINAVHMTLSAGYINFTKESLGLRG